MLVTNQTTNDYWFGPLHLAAGVGQTLTVDDTSETSLYLTDDAVADALNALYAANKITVSGQALPFPRATGVPSLFHGDGSPEGLVYGQGSLYMRRDSTLSTSTLYTKLTGVTTSTGWAAINVPTATRVTALPTTPFDLEQVVLNLNASYPGVEWQCTYNSSTGYWDAIGPPVTSYIDTRETTSSNSPADLSTVGPTVVLPYEGDYVITAGAYFGYSSGVPKIRRGSYFPSFLEPRRRSEQALVSVVQEAYVAGVSTRKVDQVVESLGLRISKSEVSRICAGLDEQVEAFRNRPLEGRYPYLWLDAKVEKVRDGGRVVRKALVLAYAVHESGYREVIGLDVGESETEAFWRSFLRSLVERGLSGVQLVVSDAHAGLKKAIGQVLGCPWQRCSVHFLREALGHARREQQPMLAALIRPIFNAESREQARELLGEALERMRKPLPKIADLLEEAEDDLLAFYAFPADHRLQAALDESARTLQP